MPLLTEDFLKKVAPTISTALRREYLKWFNIYLFQYDIKTEKRIGAFFANIMEESGRLTRTEENLNYSAKRLMQVWSRRFPTYAVAAQYAKNPRKLANYVYGGRNGNRAGTEDGWTYRGGGLMQTTGRGNYKAAGDHMGLDLVAQPELLRTPQYAVKSACVEFQKRGCNELADQRKLTEICKRINGGYNGLANRKAFYESCMRWLPDGFVLEQAMGAAAVVGASRMAQIEPQMVPDYSMAVDMGVPSWHDNDDILDAEELTEKEEPQTSVTSSGSTSSEGLTGEGLSGEGLTGEGVGLQTTEATRETVEKAATEDGGEKVIKTTENLAPAPDVVDVPKQEPDKGFINDLLAKTQETGTKVQSAFLAVPAFILTFLSGIWEKVTSGDLTLFLWLIGLSTVIVLMFIANRMYKNYLQAKADERAHAAIEKEKERAHELTLFQAQTAANRDQATVRIVGK